MRTEMSTCDAQQDASYFTPSEVQGGAPILFSTELWRVTLLGSGFHCTEGSVVEASLQYSADANKDDLREAGDSAPISFTATDDR
jgi:hypothetical protein